LTLTIVVIGQHIPRLEFLSVLLGNEAVLEPHEKLYHQLLAGNAVEAAKETDLWLNEGDYVKYLDDVVIPSLRIASDDHRRGILGNEQLARFKDSMTEYIAHIRELLDFKNEQRNAETAVSGEVVPAGKVLTAVAIAGRGTIDQGAAELVTEAIRFDLGMPTQCSSLGGLMGISAASSAVREAPPDIIVLLSVGEVTAAQLTLLRRRARRVFDGAVIIVGIGYGREPREWPDHEQDADKFFLAESVESILRSARRVASERPITPNRPPPLKLV
jgi:hypothetical protein